TGATQSVYGERAVNLEREAALWLFSNIPSLFDRPFMLPLSRGLEVHVSPAPGMPRGGFGLPLIGTRLLKRAGLQTHIDWARGEFSAWVPATRWQSWLQISRRALSGFARREIAWHAES